MYGYTKLVVQAKTEWTSFSPLSSTRVTNATPALDGAIVECTFTNSMMDILTISIKGISLAEAISFCTINNVCPLYIRCIHPALAQLN